MAWQADTISGYRDLANKIVQMATSKHVSAATINSGGSSYVVGDVLTITHAGAAMDCSIEVTSVSSGVIDGIALRNMGAFSNRLASAVVNAGGSGYAVGDVLEVEGGTYTQAAKVVVATLSGSAVATVTVQDGGGAYSSAPGLTGASTNNDPGNGSGTGCTLDLTMTSLVGTSGVSATGGSGSGATFDLTLTDTGWTALRDWNNYSYNSLTDEREVVLQGDSGTGDDAVIGFRSYSDVDGVDDRYGLVLFGMTSFNPGLSMASQVNIGPATVPSTDDASHLVCFDSSQSVWFSFTARKLAGVVKCQGSSVLAYQPFYLGLLNPFGTATENPYPMFVAGTAALRTVAPDIGNSKISSFLNPQGAPTSLSSPVWFFRLWTLEWLEVKHRTSDATVNTSYVVYPIGKTLDISGSTLPDNIVSDGAFYWGDGICLQTNAAATRLLYPSPNTGDDLFMLVPCCLTMTITSGSNTINDGVHGELDNIFWVSATKEDGSSISAEDTFTVGSDQYRVFTDGHNTQRYSYFCMKEA